MKTGLLLAASVLFAAGCARVEVRTAAIDPAVPLAPGALRPVSAVTFKDSSGGLDSTGTGVLLKRPFIDSFRDAALAHLKAMGVAVEPGSGPALELELTKASLTREQGFVSNLNASLSYALSVSSGGKTLCRAEDSGWSTVREGLISSPAGQALSEALDKAMENLGPALAASCLAAPRAAAPETTAAPAVPLAPRDPRAWALIVAVGRTRGGADSPAERAEAGQAADFAKSALGVPDDHLLLIVDELATLADLQKALGRWLPARVGPGHKVFAAFFLHGEPADGGAMLPYDGDPDALPETALSLPRLYAALERLPGKSVVVLGPEVPEVHMLRMPPNVRAINALKGAPAAFEAVKSVWGKR